MVRPLHIPAFQEELEVGQGVVTEQINDAVAARPSSARGDYPRMESFATVRKSARRGLSPEMPPMTPRIVRPISARAHQF
jgi:hypothetical protein